jgi:hypothetical protein
MGLSRVQIVRSQCAIQKSLGAKNSLANKCGAIVFELAIYYPGSELLTIALVSLPLSVLLGSFHPPHGYRLALARY